MGEYLLFLSIYSEWIEEVQLGMCLIMPKVSVIIPVYNVEKYLRECLDSVVNQTLNDIEIICIDDGSTDNSRRVLDEYAKKDSRIIILQQENQGAACARNFGMSIAQGKYLSFLDSDDVFHLDMLKNATDKAENFDADIVVFKAISLDIYTGKKVALNDRFERLAKYKNEVFSYKDIPDEIFNSFMVPAWNKVFKRDFIVNKNIQFQNIKRSNDLYFTNKALALADKIVLLDEHLVFYRTGMQSNLQATNDKTPLAFYEALCELKRFLDSEKLYTKVQKSFLNLAIETIFYNLNSVKTTSARILVADKLREDGFDFLGISNYGNLKKLNYMGYLQYQAVCITSSNLIYKFLYACFKLIQYYKLTGFKNTVKKVLVRW